MGSFTLTSINSFAPRVTMGAEACLSKSHWSHWSKKIVVLQMESSLPPSSVSLKKYDQARVLRKYKVSGALIQFWQECELIQPFWTAWRCISKALIFWIPSDKAIYFQELETVMLVCKHLALRMFHAEFFMALNNGNHWNIHQ